MGFSRQEYWSGLPLPSQVDHVLSDLFKKIRDTKGLFHAKMGTIKDRNCVDLTEAEDILKEMEYQTTWPASWEICMQVKKKQLELDMEQQADFK